MPMPLGPIALAGGVNFAVYSGREAVKQPFVSGSALSFETLMHLALDLLLVDFC
jgi:hypothetical protein